MAGILMRCTYIYMRVCVSEAKSNMLSYILILFRLVPQSSRRNRQLSRRDLPIHRLCRFEILQYQKDGWKPIFNGMFTSIFNCRISQPSIVASSLSVCVCKILQVQEKIIMQPILRKWTWTLLPHPTPPMWHDNKKWRVAGCEKTSKNMALQAVPCCVLGQGLEPVFFMNAASSRLEHRSSPDGQLDSEQQKCGISWGLKLHKWWISSAFNLQKWHF